MLAHSFIESSFHCNGCRLGKTIQLSYPSSVYHSARTFWSYWFMYGVSASFGTKGGHKYYVIFIDDHSHYTWIYFMHIVWGCASFTELLLKWFIHYFLLLSFSFLTLGMNLFYAFSQVGTLVQLSSCHLCSEWCVLLNENITIL